MQNETINKEELPEMETTLKKNHRYTGTIEKTVFGGQGIIRVDGFTVMVKNGIEGQVVEYQVSKKKKNYATAVIENIIEPSPLEISQEEQRNMLPGCMYQNIAYENQLKIKHGQLQEIFRNFTDISIPEFIPSPKQYGYRNKMEFSIGYESMDRKFVDGKKVWTDSGVAVGFHPAGSWAKVVTIDDVFIASDSCNMIRRAIENYLKENNCCGQKPWNPLISKGFWRGVIIRESVATKEMIVNFIVFESKNEEFWSGLQTMLLELELPEDKKISGILETVHTGKNDAIVHPSVSTLFGTDNLQEKLEDSLFNISPFSFFQTNTKGAEKLYATIAEKLGDTEGKTVLDLFCGTGSIGIFCSGKAEKIVGIEMVEEAVMQAARNADLNNITNADFFAGKAEDLLPHALQNNTFDSVIIDPPRSGMHPKALEYIADLPVKQMIYVSCNPTTLARDMETLSEHGWRLKEVQGVDMFPHTPHMEAVSVIERVA